MLSLGLWDTLQVEINNNLDSIFYKMNLKM